MSERDELVKRLQDLAIWMTGCGYDFTQHEYYMRNRHLMTDDIAALSAQPEQEPDAAHLQTIDERDAAEEAVSDIYYRITGRSPEWSNLFGFEHAIEEIQDAFDLVRAVAKSNTAPQSGVREGMLLDALQRAQRVMHGEGVEDQGEAWDKCAQILDEAITRAAEQVNAEQMPATTTLVTNTYPVTTKDLMQHSAPQSEQTHVSVPRVPTEQMLHDGLKAAHNEISLPSLRLLWSAMLRAATGKESEHE